MKKNEAIDLSVVALNDEDLANVSGGYRHVITENPDGTNSESYYFEVGDCFRVHPGNFMYIVRTAEDGIAPKKRIGKVDLYIYKNDKWYWYNNDYILYAKDLAAHEYMGKNVIDPLGDFRKYFK